MPVQYCPNTNDLIQFLEGRTPNAVHDALEKHITNCPKCLSTIESLEVEDDVFTWQLRYLCNSSATEKSSQLKQVMERLEKPDSPLFQQHRSNHSDLEEYLGGTLGDYRLIRELGRGGMGVVYEAEQISLHRRVALKTLPMASLLDKRRLQRFQNEARAVANLHHPHIITIYAVGIERGVHYFAMEFIEGLNLAQVIDSLRRNEGLEFAINNYYFKSSHSEHEPAQTTVVQRREHDPDSQAAQMEIKTDSPVQFTTDSLPTKADDFTQIVKLMEQAGTALAYAHENGIIHRDVKPANMMLDNKGNIWLTDFGVAHIESDATLTRTGDVFGTLRYMSPEQASGRPELVDRRTDVYSLGATLYELITLKPLFSGDNKEELLRKISGDSIIPPRQINPAIPVDLETIILKATAHDLEDRYSTAEQMAYDLSCFLENRPISAKLPNRWDRSIKWLHRNRTLATLLLSGLSVILVLVLIFVYYLSALNTALIAEQKNTEAANQKTIAALFEAKEQNYVNSMMLASAAAKEMDSNRVEKLISPFIPKPGEPDLRGVEWFVLKNKALKIQIEKQYSAKHLNTICKFPERNLVATAGAESVLYLLHDDTLEIRKAIPTDQIEVYGLAFSPNGTQIASTGHDGTIKFWNTDTGMLEKTIIAYVQAEGEKEPKRVLQVKFSPDGQSMVTSANDDVFKLWDVATGEFHGEFIGHEMHAQVFDISPDGKLLVTGSFDTTVRLWDMETQKQLKLLKLQPRIIRSVHVLDVAFSNDQNKVAIAAKDHSVYLWDHQNNELKLIGLHDDPVETVFFSANEQQLIAGDRSGTIKIWDASQPVELWKGISANPVHSETLHDKRITAGILDEQPNQLLTIGRDGFLRQTLIQSDESDQVLKKHQPVKVSCYSTKNGKLALVVADKLCFLQQIGHEFVSVWKTQHSNIASIAIPEEESFVVTGQIDGIVNLWDWNNQQHISNWIMQAGEPINQLTISSDGKWLVANLSKETLHIHRINKSKSGSFSIDLKNGVEIEGHRARFSPDGSRFAFSRENSVFIWDCETSSILWELPGHLGGVNNSVFGSHGNKLYVADNNRAIHIWDTQTGAEILPPWQTTSNINSLLLMPDGRTLISSDEEDRLTFWNVNQGQPMHSVSFPRSRSIFVTTDGRLIAQESDGVENTETYHLNIYDFGDEWREHIEY